jgi:hypothetical protein
MDGFSYRLKLTERIVKAIGMECVDVVVLNGASPLLRNQAVKVVQLIQTSIALS